jgi:hypothetical protein
MMSLLMGNLHAYRATDPLDLATAEDRCGPENAAALKAMLQQAELIIAAWGAFPLHAQAKPLVEWLCSLEKTRCLGRTKSGAPLHPRSVPKTAVPVR